MKKKWIIITMSVFCFILASCDAFLDLFPQTVQYNCDWHYDKRAVFYNVDLEFPCNSMDCEYSFQNYFLENYMYRYSLYSAMTNLVQHSINSSFDFKWTATIVSAKSCSAATGQSKAITLDQNTYTQSFVFYNDIMECSPYVPDSNYIYPNEHMYKIEFQIFNVENEYDHTEGTLTWNYVWEKPTATGSAEWYFNFPNNGIKGTYIPNSNYTSTRHIYIHDQYEDI